MTVFAASRGLNVDAMTEIVDRMSRMRSRLHNGQFFIQSVQNNLFRTAMSYEWVIWITGWLRDKDD